jgi:23S rRNA G2445 N2-methylase RlmL
VVTNPPYGDRLQADDGTLNASWQALGHFLHRECGRVAYVLCGNADLTRNLGLRATACRSRKTVAGCAGAQR